MRGEGASPSGRKREGGEGGIKENGKEEEEEERKGRGGSERGRRQ